jgi:hypothetical protein
MKNESDEYTKNARWLTNEAMRRAFGEETYCPKCFGRDIGSTDTEPRDFRYRCFDCGHTGTGREFRRPEGALKVWDEKEE